ESCYAWVVRAGVEPYLEVVVLGRVLDVAERAVEVEVDEQVVSHLAGRKRSAVLGVQVLDLRILFGAGFIVHGVRDLGAAVDAGRRRAAPPTPPPPRPPPP